ncbi:MAG: VOC family protein [Acidobacteriia bacterium]|nr:VOC family protein [Terriglobia bacterium]
MSRHNCYAIGRREMLGVLGAGMLAAHRTFAAAESLRFAGLDHVEFTVSNVESTAVFYARIFGTNVLKNNRTSRRYVKLGDCFIAADIGKEIRVDHFCAGIEGFEISGLHAYLDQRGIPYKDFPSGKDLYVTDPDGIHVQLGAANSWNDLLKGTASPETIPASGDPIFRPTGLDHILLNVSDPGKSAVFYEKIFGPVTQRNNNRTWFQAGKSRIGLLEVSAGQKPGVNHYCVSAAAFDYNTAGKRLEQAGAKLEAAEVNGAPEFRDADGYLVQVMTPRAPNSQK